MDKKTAIVIDDDVGITEIFSEMLEFHGMDVIGIGHNGIEAIDLFKKYSPDFVFMDINMPKLDGVGALTEIKKISSQSQVIIITSDTSTELKNKVEGIGASAIIYKPFSVEKIVQITENIKNSPKMLIQ